MFHQSFGSRLSLISYSVLRYIDLHARLWWHDKVYSVPSPQDPDEFRMCFKVGQRDHHHQQIVCEHGNGEAIGLELGRVDEDKQLSGS